MQRNLAVLIAPFVFVLICLANYASRKPTIDNHLDGFYVLELIRVTENGVDILPLYLYPDAQWGYYLCESEKSSLRKHMGGRSPNVIIECFKQGNAEI